MESRTELRDPPAGPICRNAYEALAKKIFSNPARFGFESFDEAVEAFLQHQRRLKTVVERSLGIAEGAPAYVDTCMRYLAKSVQRTRRRRETLELVLESSELPRDAEISVPGSDLPRRSLLTSGKDPISVSLLGERLGFITAIAPSCFMARMDASQKRLLYLILKCAWEVNDEILLKSSRRIGVPECWLEQSVLRARSSLDEILLRRERIRHSLNLTWVRIRLTEEKLERARLGLEQRTGLERKLARERDRYHALLRKLERNPPLVTNRAIAGLLGIPKGTVDSGLYYFKAEASRRLALNPNPR